MIDYIIDTNEIHCWVIDLDMYVNAAPRYLDFLSDAEKHRSNRFAFKELKERYVVSHGILNILLASYLKTQQFEISFGRYGKPFIKDSFLHFNLSHSNRYACIAFANFEIGVDIELMKDDSVVESIFSKNEKELYDNIQGHLQQQAFYQAWVRKEAYLKALGTGLSQPIDEVEVGFNTPPEWSFIPIPISEHYIGCIATKRNSSPNENLIKIIKKFTFLY